MKCPRCDTDIQDVAPTCTKCGFGIKDLDKALAPLPDPLGAVSDYAKMISPVAAKRVEGRIKLFEARTNGAQLRVVTRETTAPRKPAEYAFWLFNRWNVGDANGDENRGLLILLAKAERAIQCEVGYALEEIVSDQAAGDILDAHVVPFLAKGAIDEGVYQAVDVLAQVIEGGDGRRPLWRRILGR